MNVDPALILARASGWTGSQRRASAEGRPDVVGEDVEPQEPALTLDAVELGFEVIALARASNPGGGAGSLWITNWASPVCTPPGADLG